MGFNWKRGLAAGAAGGLDTYGSMLKADRAASAEQVRLNAQQSRDENMLRFGVTLRQGEEQAAYDKSKERRPEEAEYAREKASLDAKARIKDNTSPEAVAGRKALLEEELFALQEKDKQKVAATKEERDRVLKNLEENKDLYTPDEYRMLTDKAKGTPVIKGSKETGTQLKMKDWMTARTAAKKAADERYPGDDGQSIEKAALEMKAWDQKFPRPTGKKRGATIGQLKEAEDNKKAAEVKRQKNVEIAEAGTETLQDKQALAAKIAEGDKQAQLVVSFVSPEKQAEIKLLVERLKGTHNVETMEKPAESPGQLRRMPPVSQQRYPEGLKWPGATQ